MKNKKIILVTIILVIISFLGGAAFSTIIFNQKSEAVTNDAKDKKDNGSQKEAVTNDAKDKKDNGSQKGKRYSLSDISKIIDTYGDFFIEDKSFSEVSKEDLRMVLFNNAFHGENRNVSLEEFNKTISNSPFNSMGIEPGDIGFDVSCKSLIQYKYNNETKVFEYQELPGHDCGFGSYPIISDTVVDDYRYENNKYVVTEYVIYYRNVPEDRINFYGTYEDALNEKNSIYYTQIDNFKYKWRYYGITPYITNNILEEYKDKLTKVVFTFEEKNGVLTLTDVTK